MIVIQIGVFESLFEPSHSAQYLLLSQHDAQRSLSLQTEHGFLFDTSNTLVRIAAFVIRDHAGIQDDPARVTGRIAATTETQLLAVCIDGLDPARGAPLGMGLVGMALVGTALTDPGSAHVQQGDAPTVWITSGRNGALQRFELHGPVSYAELIVMVSAQAQTLQTMTQLSQRTLCC